ncbi:MAG: hydroxymethylbilane synthase [Planctomycetia bacterium]|nr:hydroxymethylbilane synthase [Planctomycetia bacterium]
MTTSASSPILVATRASTLALRQAEHVVGLLKNAAPGASVATVHVSTSGDRDLAASLKSFGGMGVFTREVQQAVLDGRGRLAVHSLKDLPTESVPGLCLAAVPPREVTADALVLPRAATALAAIEQLPAGTRIGTGSLRRQAQLKHLRPDVQVGDVRGNVETRLKKLDAGDFDALVLAVAGLKRLALESRISLQLGPPQMYAAVGQGALGLECRADDAELREILKQIDDPSARSRVTAERALLAHLRAGCHAPVGTATCIDSDDLVLEAVVLSPDGKERLFATAHGPTAGAAALGAQVGDLLLAQGADRLISARL